ncbi:Lrp/AsnC family transcriptional regulator [Vibrio hepatarius]|jgi:DNA-binding Lrp family transcriptional regulator|uniref:Leucine-responsive regulatory protein n=1 Tax=Vibrio hepatarius TaxID=171383 RepID=A0A0M0I4G5_9VIBR|nr:Lrp/AsnC family transcriptional regulator [Vibrio hepatarius]KOO09194.1 AsnC family transcriptional regulator [Vibrio hepatarius]NOI14078.1 Lrp/AsnC family transcriptional regulator [Vibrio hepatarius]
MDRFDERILHELKTDGRISNVELAERIGLSASATLRRVQELEKKGVIKGYRAMLNSVELGIGFIAYVSIGLSSHSKQAQKAFEEHVRYVNEVVECHNITGANEYLLRVETKDLPSYKKFHADVLGECVHVQSITTMVVMDSPKDER